MNMRNNFRKLAPYALAAILAGSGTGLWAAESGNATKYPYDGWHHGLGMMGGWGYGMGPGMMGGYGMGPGMMGGGWGYGMGPGMMGGYGYGMGPGMMGGFWGSGLNLTDDQQAKINRIQDETRRAHWALMGQMMDLQAKLRDLYEAKKPDEAAIDDTYKSLSELQQSMFKTMLDGRKRMEAVLTKEQQEQLRKDWRRGRGSWW